MAVAVRNLEENNLFYKKNSDNYRQGPPGVVFKTLTYGKNTSLGEFRLKKGRVIPTHTHPHEQIGYLISGHVIFHIAGEKYEARPGDSWCIPGNVEHSVDIIEDSLVIEVFSPVREDYL